MQGVATREGSAFDRVEAIVVSQTDISQFGESLENAALERFNFVALVDHGFGCGGLGSALVKVGSRMLTMSLGTDRSLLGPDKGRIT